MTTSQSPRNAASPIDEPGPFENNEQRTLYHMRLDGTLEAREGRYSWFHTGLRREYPQFWTVEPVDAAGFKSLLTVGRHCWQLTQEEALADAIDRAEIELRQRRGNLSRAEQSVRDAQERLEALRANRG